MKPSSTFCVSSICVFAACFAAFSQEAILRRSITLAPSTSLLIKEKTEAIVNPNEGKPVQPLPGAFLDKSKWVKDTYTVVLQRANSQVDLDQAEFAHSEGSMTSAMPRFSVFDAILDGDKLHYLFTKSGKVFLAVATVSPDGKVSGYRQTLLPDKFTTIDDARFVRDHEGKATLRFRASGSTITKAFQFDDAGTAFSVPADKMSSIPLR